MEERRVSVAGDVGINMELGLNDVGEPGTEFITEAERRLLDSLRILLRGRINAILEGPDGDEEKA
ncbi:MAG: hypothetical protein ACREIS_13465 [Nitrospiraceae bacterium]